MWVALLDVALVDVIFWVSENLGNIGDSVLKSSKTLISDDDDDGDNGGGVALKR